ncbi:MAG: hypothetical protein AB4058_16120 [Microcystaceae cyanobacterium]
MNCEGVERRVKLSSAIQDHQGFYIIRIDNYRLGLYLEGNMVALVRLLHRKDMYRYFP